MGLDSDQSKIQFALGGDGVRLLARPQEPTRPPFHGPYQSMLERVLEGNGEDGPASRTQHAEEFRNDRSIVEHVFEQVRAEGLIEAPVAER